MVMMGQWFTPNIIGGAQERVPGGRIRTPNPRAHNRELTLQHKLEEMREEVASARCCKETYRTAGEFADISLATKASRDALNRDPKPRLSRPNKPPLDAFFERQLQTTNAQIGSFAEYDEKGDAIKSMTRMPRMPELRHKLMIGELGAPLTAQQRLPTEELKRQAFEHAATARNASAIAKRRAIFEPVVQGLKETRRADVLADPKLFAALRKLKTRVSLVEQEREIVAILDRQPKKSSQAHGEYWLKQQRELQS